MIFFWRRDPERLADAVYGTILVTALIAAYSEYDGASSTELLGAVVSGTLVLWLAHVYSVVVSRRMAEPASKRLLLSVAAQETPVLEAAAGPALVLALAAAGAVGDSLAAEVAIGAGVVSLFGWGYAIGAREGRSLGGRLVSGTVNAGFGLAIVGLKIVAH